MHPHPQIINNVRDRLNKAGLSASAAAKIAGIASTTLSRPLNDPAHRYTLSTSTLQALCGPLECSLADLVGSAAIDQYVDLRCTFRAAREAKGITQKQLADMLATHWITISKVERGVIQLSRLWIDRLSKALDIEVSIKPGPALKTEESSTGLATKQLASPQNSLATEEFSPAKLSELHEYIEEINDLLHALDKVGDGIGGSDGYAVSAVALNAKSVAGNALSLLQAMEGSK